MSNHGFINISEPFLSIWSNKGRSRFRWERVKLVNFFSQNSLIQVWKSMLKHRTHPGLYKSSHLKVDFCIQLLVKFQILIHFLWQMLDFCLGCGNKKCWVWFLAMTFCSSHFYPSGGTLMRPYNQSKQPYSAVERLHLNGNLLLTGLFFSAIAGFLTLVY